MFYAELFTDFSTAGVEKCFEAVAEGKFRVSSSEFQVAEPTRYRGVVLTS